ncbi:bifunctional diguanylate cyclase/phosphodiesterase [Marinobacterium mangrovicola]|uniref:Diguanylate cyclase (GGDEF)-like protein n=1 Tax=Marinobacterium mangrovicola TaxID=1476959 RepID=A0A4R1GEH1_9GAMM|nr:EAL domain-containing protein [Marinobacterium mangrovicola]TCK04159.1 diguanylate cyclase (GGDEF)-like protein [Marinobacterium mangrovicola]
MQVAIFRTSGLILAVALCYLTTAFLASGVGLHEQIMPFWVPAGVALGAALRFGPRILPGVLLGNLAFNLLITLSWKDSIDAYNILTASLIGSGAALQAGTSAFLIKRFDAYPLAPKMGRSLLWYVLLAGPLSCIISASIGTSAVYEFSDAGGSAGYWKDWLTWWISDSFGAIVITPVVLVLLNGNRMSGRRRLALISRLGIIMAGALVLNSLFLDRLSNQLRRDFMRDTQLIEARLSAVMQKNLTDLATLGRRFAENGTYSPAYFAQEAEKLIEDNPGLRAYSWDPIVQQSEREVFEQYTAELIDEPEYEIYGESLYPEDPLIPVQMVEPRESNRSALGLNLLSLEDRRRSVIQAQATGRAVATEILNLAQAPDQPGLLILQPVYHMGGNRSLLYRQRNLVGFMVGVFTLNQLLENSLRSAGLQDISVRLTEEGARESFYSDFPSQPNSELIAAFDLEVAQRTWHMEATPNANYMAAHPSSNAVDLQGLLALVAILGTMLTLATHDRERVLLAEVRRQTQSLAYQARHDDLTGLPNRSNLLETLRTRLAEPGGEPFALLFIDLDRFKLINDSLGHQIGDHLLVALARKLEQQLPADVRLFRMGGDEFILMVDGDRQRACVEADRLLIAAGMPMDVDNIRLQVTASIGISLYPKHGDDLITLIKYADTAMYRAKAQGKNRYLVHSEEFSDQTFQSFSLEQDLRVALGERQLLLHYQPQFDLKTGELLGAEALVRWQHPERGLLAPGEFIELAEETQLIIPLGWQVIELACEQVASWNEQGLKMPCVAVNISPQQLLQMDFVEKLNALVDSHHIARDTFELEITELMIMQDPDLAMLQLHKLRESGYRIALDDFGTGYSSLDRLKHLPLDRLKIDQAFTRDIGRNSRDEAVILTIIALGSALGIEVLAEGVETQAQLDFLCNNDCNSVQGYLLGRPVAPDQLPLETPS